MILTITTKGHFNDNEELNKITFTLLLIFAPTSFTNIINSPNFNLKYEFAKFQL